VKLEREYIGSRFAKSKQYLTDKTSARQNIETTSKEIRS
jgi:hypothetical protein